MKKTHLFIILLSGFLWSFCTNKNERDFLPTPVNNSDPSSFIKEREISFKNEISPIIQGMCIDCHSPKSTNPNSPGDYFYTLDGTSIDYEGVKKKVDEKYLGSTLSKIEERIISNNPDFRMPYKIQPLDPEQIKIIRSWIAQGAKNN